MSNNENPFNVLGKQSTPPNLGSEITVDAGELKDRITALLGSSDVILFMKGNPLAPQCGFSANTVGILNQLGKEFKTFDILRDPEIRQGLKEYSNWPTYPQLYVKGKLVGGNDIITEMFESGDLQEYFQNL